MLGKMKRENFEWTVDFEDFLHACKHDDMELVIKYLEANNNNLRNIPSNKKFPNSTPLMIAAENGNYEIVKFLLKLRGCDPNAQNENGDTALILATSKGYSLIVKTLISASLIVDIDLKNKKGLTAGQIALTMQHREIIDTIRNRSLLNKSLYFLNPEKNSPKSPDQNQESKESKQIPVKSNPPTDKAREPRPSLLDSGPLPFWMRKDKEGDFNEHSTFADLFRRMGM